MILLLKSIKDPARLQWREVRKVDHYYLSIDAVTQPMQVREGNSLLLAMMTKSKDISGLDSKTIQRSLTYSFAHSDDKSQIRQLLSECGLPTLYIHRHLKSFMVAKAGKKIVGVVGVEIYGRMGLFRSLCVDEAYRGRGIAKILNEKLLAYARTRKIERLYLFTLYAEKFASKLGFRNIDKKRIPRSIRATWQFRKSLCYPSVICMMKKTTASPP